MSEGDPTPDDAQAAVAALRAASSRVAELDAPAAGSSVESPDGPGTGAGPDAPRLPGGGLDPDFDVAEHAERFEELHDALASVLATLDRT